IEQVEDQTDRRLRLLVGIEDDLARGTAHVADGHRFAEFAPTRLGFPARQHPCLEDMKLGFRHRSFQTQKEAIVVVGRIIHPVGVGDQRVEQRTDLQKLMPVPAGARQPRHLHAEHEANLAEADLGDQPLKAEASFDARAGASEIVVDDDDLLAQPAKLRRPVRERILQLGRLLMALNLLRRGLADIDDRQTILMARENLFAGRAAATLDKARIRHWTPPWRPWSCASDAKPSVPGASLCVPVVPGATASRSTPADRSSRDPSQRARADSASNPILGDSSGFVNLSAVSRMGYR